MRRAFFSSLGGSTYGRKKPTCGFQAVEGIDGILLLNTPPKQRPKFCQQRAIFAKQIMFSFWEGEEEAPQMTGSSYVGTGMKRLEIHINNIQDISRAADPFILTKY